MRMHMHIFFTVYMCKCTHIFCICVCWHTDICLKHIYTCNVYVYSCLLACFLIMFIFHDLVGKFCFLTSLSSERKAHSFAILLLAGSIEHLLRTTVEVVHVIHCVK